jgi:hypothetical protein
MAVRCGKVPAGEHNHGKALQGNGLGRLSPQTIVRLGMVLIGRSLWGYGMEIIDTVRKISLADSSSILSYWDSPLIKSLYFTPKYIFKNKGNETFDSELFISKIK